MKWMGWGIALLCLCGLAAVKAWDANRLRAVAADLEANLAETRQEAEERIGQARKTGEEQPAFLAKLQEKYAETLALREEYRDQEVYLKETILHLVAETERLRQLAGAFANPPGGEREELEERISQAERNAAIGERMIRMVSEPEKAL
ncbi:MAG: hypothetical protein RBU25_04020 [Lentisphaeria bacterium]|nr:hypothetical protein [Lentisphaeria bacterium]